MHINIFEAKSDKELSILYKQFLEAEKTIGFSDDNELGQIKRQYEKDFGVNTVLMLQIELTRAIADRWYTNHIENGISNLNSLLDSVGISFDVSVEEKSKKLFIEVDEKKLKAATDSKGGRPVEHSIDFSEVEKMKADGMTNKDIYTKLGISKSLFYLKMKEYKNDIV